ncbi:hypothetical protein [Melghirimyces algeriensis]|uniref:Pilus assembly protein, PilO n=1 Tax=Melghirimyces algeriensis TaxID=910412 RepID=A0A521EPH0_9BACL|nr:hypothetical protein [Melghirimyces algeriensis]SMO85817.1 hypothetical protein SAMN06264849_11049 [Melghirimyces algeriensis]
MIWNRKPKPYRPIGRWKNGKTLFFIWAGGTILILLATLTALYPFLSTARQVQAEEAEIKAFKEKHHKILHPEWQPPVKPTEGELSALQEKVPLEAEPARLIIQLQKAVKDSGAKWVEFRTAEDISNLQKREEEDGENLQKKREQMIPLLPRDSHLHPYWADLYVEGTESELLSLFGTLHQMQRIISVQGWEYIANDKKPGKIRIRLVWYVYQDSKLKGLPTLPDLQIPKTDESEERDETSSEKKETTDDETFSQESDGTGQPDIKTE